MIRLGPTQRALLQLIEQHPCGITSKALREKLDKRADNVRKILRSLFDSAAIHMAEAGWRISPLGEKLLKDPALLTPAVRQAKRKALPDQSGKVAGPRRYFPTGTYTGADLRPQQTRPSGNDALALPSLINGVRVPHPSQINQPE